MEKIQSSIIAGVTAILLAGGSSQRMGLNKAMAIIRGMPLIQHIHLQLESLFDEIIISAEDTGLYAFLGSQIVPDEKPGQGPLMGLFSAMKAASNPVVFACACDIPVISTHHVNQLHETLGTDDAAVLKNLQTGHVEPLFAFYRSSVSGPIASALEKNQRKMDSFYSSVTVNYLPFESNSWFMNLNSPTDLQRFLEDDNGSFGFSKGETK